MIQELSLQSFFHAFALLSVAHHTPKNRNRMPCFGHMWSIRYRSTMRHKRANRMAQQARILSITNIKYRWKPPAASLDIENENIQLRHENSTATSRNNFSASTVLNDCAHFLHHSKFDTTEISTGGGRRIRRLQLVKTGHHVSTMQSLWPIRGVLWPIRKVCDQIAGCSVTKTESLWPIRKSVTRIRKSVTNSKVCDHIASLGDGILKREKRQNMQVFALKSARELVKPWSPKP